MDFKLIRTIVILSFVFLTLLSCGNKKDNRKNMPRVVENKEYKPTITDEASINGVYLELLNNNNRTELKIINDKDTVLLNDIEIKPPCYFLKNSDNKLASFSYPDVDIKETIIIIGDLFSDKEKEEIGLSNYDKVCGNTIQGLLIKTHNTIEFSKNTVTGTPTCQDIFVDEKVFWSFAHD